MSHGVIDNYMHTRLKGRGPTHEKIMDVTDYYRHNFSFYILFSNW